MDGRWCALNCSLHQPVNVARRHGYCYDTPPVWVVHFDSYRGDDEGTSEGLGVTPVHIRQQSYYTGLIHGM